MSSLIYQQRLNQAKKLLQEKRYSEARSILIGMNHPTAHKWLAQLEETAPSTPQQAAMKEDDVFSEFDDLSDDELDALIDESVLSTPQPTQPNYATTVPQQPYRSEIGVRAIVQEFSLLRNIAKAFLAFSVLNFIAVPFIFLFYIQLNLASALIMAVVTAMSATSWLAFSELLLVMAELAENSRTQIRLLDKIAQRLQ